MIIVYFYILPSFTHTVYICNIIVKFIPLLPSILLLSFILTIIWYKPYKMLLLFLLLKKFNYIIII